MRNNNLIGTGVALITPFNEDYSIDFESLKKLINKLINQNIDYFVVMGTTAESVTLSVDEQNILIDYVKKIVDKRVPIVLGVGGNHTEEVVNRIKSLDFTGVEAILSVCPYYNKPSQSGLFLHYSSLAEVCPVDILLYNVPSRTGVNIDPDTVVKLANNYSNIIGIKEASGDISQAMELLSACPDEFMVISGDDKMTFSIMVLGGLGVISVQAMVFPLLFSNMVDSILKNDIPLARKYHYELLKSVDVFYVDGNPSGVKEALKFLGLCSSNQVRLPLVKMHVDNAKKLHRLISETLDTKN